MLKHIKRDSKRIQTKIECDFKESQVAPAGLHIYTLGGECVTLSPS